MHSTSCTAHKNHLIRRIRARIPRTRYCFSINRPRKEIRWFLALDRVGWPIFIIALFWCTNYPIRIGKFEETSSKGKKDIAECVHESRYLTTQIIKLKATNLLSRCRLKLHDFSTNYRSNCSIRSRISNYQAFLKWYFKDPSFQLSQNVTRPDEWPTW